jgi:hypothetical protein
MSLLKFKSKTSIKFRDYNLKIEKTLKHKNIIKHLSKDQ